LALEEVNGQTPLSGSRQKMQENEEPAMMDADLADRPLDLMFFLNPGELANDVDSALAEPAFYTSMTCDSVLSKMTGHGR
jgi:hypothetical protein